MWPSWNTKLIIHLCYYYPVFFVTLFGKQRLTSKMNAGQDVCIKCQLWYIFGFNFVVETSQYSSCSLCQLLMFLLGLHVSSLHQCTVSDTHVNRSNTNPKPENIRGLFSVIELMHPDPRYVLALALNAEESFICYVYNLYSSKHASKLDWNLWPFWASLCKLAREHIKPTQAQVIYFVFGIYSLFMLHIM